MSKIDEEIYAYLKIPENLETALSLADSLLAVKIKIFEVFWENVQQSLRNKLQQAGFQGNWQVDKRGPVDKNYSMLGLFQKTDPTNSFYVVAECLTGKPRSAGGCYFGVRRQKEIPKEKLVESERRLVDVLNGEGFSGPESVWSGYKYFRDHGLPDFDIDKSEDVKRINLDNTSGSGEMAGEVVDYIWSVFERHRTHLESLNAAHPYTNL